MGFLLTLLWWLTAATATSLAVYLTIGDKVVSFLLRHLARAYVGPNFTVTWSLASGMVEIHDLALGRALLPAIEPYLGLPMELEYLRVKRYRLELPWTTLLAKKTQEEPLESTIEIDGMELGITLDEPEKWLAMRDENAARFEQAVKDAAAARLARAEWWTTTVVQKLKELVAARAASAAKKAGTTDTTKPVPPPAWHAQVDKVLDSFLITMVDSTYIIHDDHTGSDLGVSVGRYEISRATSASSTSDNRRKRVLRFENYAVFVNPVARSSHEKKLYFVKPMNYEVQVFMPYIFQSLLMGEIPETRAFVLVFTATEEIEMQLRPAQLSKMMAILRPYWFYCDWYQRALVQDEASCVDLVGAERDQYIEVYRDQYKLEHDTGFVGRLISRLFYKDRVLERKQRLKELEEKVLATRILYLRSMALDWDVPSGGTAILHTSGSVKRRKDLQTFLSSPLTKYEPDVPENPMFHSFSFSMNASSVDFQLLENNDKPVLSLFAQNATMGFQYAMTFVGPKEKALDFDLKAERFAVFDERNVSTNVFRHLVDQSPDARHLFAFRVTQTGDGHLDVDFALEDVTVLLVFDSLLYTSKVFLPAFTEDEATEIRYLAYANLQAPQSIEQREAATPVYKREAVPDYTPLMLGGMLLRAHVVINRCELCLLGDSSSLKSHVLAFTSDMTMNVVSSKRHEAIEIELADVALQPCTIVILQDAIDLDMAGRRSILELEGEGVDLLLGYKLIVGESKPKVSSTTTSEKSTEEKRSGSQMWSLARTALSKKEIVETQPAAPADEQQTNEDGSVAVVKVPRTKAGARRKLVMRMSDFALNMSANDLGVLLSISASLSESMKEDAQVVKDREERARRVTKAKKDLEEAQFLERLKAEFQLRDADGGGTLDTEEISSLIQSVANCQNLTKEEFEATVREFIAIVDRDGSGDISLEEFESVLSRKKVVYHRLHRGVVSLTGSEYVDASRPRSSVPSLNDGTDIANMAALAQFWERYEQQVGATRTSLNGIPAVVVQKKMVRAFKNFEYAQEAWLRLVNPSLAKPAEKSPWLLTKEMDMGSRGNVIDQLLTSFDNESTVAIQPARTSQLRIFIHTVISTSFGGFYIRLIDDNSANRIPTIEFCTEELAIYANYASWEGATPTPDNEVAVLKQSRENDYGIAKVSFAIYGKYYNTTSRQVEPFLEYFPGTLDIHKEPASHTDVVFASDRYFQMNITYGFMEVVKTNLSTFSKVEAKSERARPHIKEEGGYFWMLNETGLNMQYFVVAKKQIKERIHVETVTAVSSVPPNEAHPCILLSVDEDDKDFEQQNLKEKQLRQAFRNADADCSGELDTHEVRAVLLEVYEEELKSRKHDRRSSFSRDSMGASSTVTRSESAFSNEADLDRLVDDFIALADTDGSGQVSWDEFKVAISKQRQTVERFVSLEIEGFEQINNIPLTTVGHTQVYELTPRFEEVDNEQSIALLYQQGIMLLNSSEDPSREDLQKAYACFRRVRDMDPYFEWIDSYYSDCVRKFLPVLVAVQVTMDGVIGFQVKVSSAEYIRNDTVKPTECLFLDGRRQISSHNPPQGVRTEGEGEESFFVLPPNGSIPIPLDLVDVGYFAIRQIGETDWSNFLQLSVREQRIFKNLTRFEQREANRALRADSQSDRLSLSATMMVSEKMGNEVSLPNPADYVPPGKEVSYPSTAVIDNQPTVVVEKISVNDSQLGTWSIVIQPQLVLQNALPCGVEYAIVQTRDCPEDALTSQRKFQLTAQTNGKRPTKFVNMVGEIDYFEYVNEINCRRLFIESGKSAQVFGLDLDEPALMKMRLCASGTESASPWSPPFIVNLNASREVFDKEEYEIQLGEQTETPQLVLQQQWAKNAARSLMFYAPYWIQNRSGLDFRFRLPKGSSLCSIEGHREYFSDSKDIPLLVNAPSTKALLSVRPFQATPESHESEFLLFKQTKKCLPNFDRVSWSEQIDISTVGTKGELAAKDRSFIVAFEILAGPGQFFRSKICRLSPRVIVVNRVPRPLEITPLMLDKKFRGSSLRGSDAASANTSMTEGESLVVYRFAGKEKHHPGLRLRDTFRDEALKDIGDWTPCVPIRADDDFSVWTRGSLGDGPASNIAFTNTEETIISVIEDISTKAKYRIENRSTRYAFRYTQNGVKNAEEIVIKPLETHSFVWDDPLATDRKLKVTPLSWKIPTLIDLKQIGPGPMLTSNTMYSEVYLDGSTRVFAVGETPTYVADRQNAALSDWLSHTFIDLGILGFGLTIVDGHPQEVMNITMENMRILSDVGSRRVTFSLHHMQIDDMTPHSLYPIVLAPLDTGFNSDKREGWLPKDGERPFFTLAIDTLPGQSGITIVNDFEVGVNSMAMKLNLEYFLCLMNLLWDFIPSSDEETILQQGIDYKKLLLTLEISIPEHAGHGGILLYFKRWCMTPYDFELVFDSVAEENGDGISSLLGSTVGSIVGGIAHVTPEFSFDMILYENRFFYEYDLVYAVIRDIVMSVLGQWYKIVGSVELLGDPVGLATDIVDGFALAARQLKRDVKGQSLRKGQSALTLVQTVVGAPMRSIGKVSNGLGDVVKKATDFQSQEEEGQPRHVPEGLVQGGVVFGKSLAYGVKGLFKEPVQGAKKGGVVGFAKGVGRGTLQLVASPVVGTLGVVEKLSMSVSNTTHLLDEKSYEGTRRPARDLGASGLKPLSESNVITEVELHVLNIEGLPVKSNPKVVVRVYQQEKGGPARDIAKFKTTTLHHTGAPEFDQSWLIPVSSLDTFVEIQVQHKRKPLPKKLLGLVRLSMEDIYRDFEGVPAKILADTQAKLRLRRRKRVRGSILNELATSSSSFLEVRDESWRQRISRPSMQNFMSDEFEDDQDENFDYEQEAQLLTSSRTIPMDQPLEIHPVGIPLEGAENPNAKLFVSIRYVNDMRRYA